MLRKLERSVCIFHLFIKNFISAFLPSKYFVFFLHEPILILTFNNFFPSDLLFHSFNLFFNLNKKNLRDQNFFTHKYLLVHSKSPNKVRINHFLLHLQNLFLVSILLFKLDSC